MEQTPPLRWPPELAQATQQVRAAARGAAEHTVDSLGLAALASTDLVRRDALLGAQYELGRKIGLFSAAFNDALDTEVARQAGLLTPTPRPDVTPESLVASWDLLTLVDDHEVELHISAERFAQDIAHSCEWELREFDAYMATLMQHDSADHARNPLRAELVAQAMMRAIDAVSGRPEVRKALATELGRALAQAMRRTYAELVTDLRKRGVRPIGMAVRASKSTKPSQPAAWPATALGTSLDTASATRPGEARAAPASPPGAFAATRPGAIDRGGSGHSVTATWVDSGRPTSVGDAAHTLGEVQAELAQLIRHLADISIGAGEAEGAPMAGRQPQGEAARPRSAAGAALVAPNLIATHRAALQRHASGALDRMVIDLVAGLFDEILSDSKVPPQFARQIARLQLPVLRAALGNNQFFSAPRHPVRQLVNRIASLGTASGDDQSARTRALLEQVATAVQAVVEGDFERAETYERQLLALDQFVAAQAQAELKTLGDPGQVLARKEQALQVQQQFALALALALKPLALPAYLDDFTTRVWATAIAHAEFKEGPQSPLAKHLRELGVELLMSIQPKGDLQQRQALVQRLPRLMKGLGLGMDHARCADEVRRDFYAQLLPAHAEALKSRALSTLEHNLLLRQVQLAMATPVPACDGAVVLLMPDRQAPQAGQAAQDASQDDAAQASFSPAEARAVGLVTEQAVDWHTSVDIDLGADAEVSAVDIQIDGLPPAQAPEPTRGRALADHVQLGFAYQMFVGGAWHEVRLAHVSAARSFFVFTHGRRQRRTVSLTLRMLLRMCDEGRMRALEAAYLLERATVRARRQLAQVRPLAH